jgi:hypothetical protein
MRVQDALGRPHDHLVPVLHDAILLQRVRRREVAPDPFTNALFPEFN